MNTEIEIIKDAINLLERHKSKLGTIASSDTYRIDVILSILSNIESSEEEWLEKCKYLYPKYRIEFLTDLNSLQASTPEIIPNLIEEIYCRCAYFLREYILYMESHNSYEYRFGMDELSLVHNKILDDNHPFIDPKNSERLDVIKDKQLDIWILGYYFYGKSFKSFERYEELVEDSEKKSFNIENQINLKKDELSKFINDKKEEVVRLAQQLEQQKTAFNFVGLSQGFESLLKAKKNSQTIVLSLLFFIGIFLFIPLFTYIELNQVKDLSGDFLNWKMFLPFVSIELISLYLFRVILTHYNSIKTQIMQLELRQTLCQFIQSYVEYAKEIKEKDSASLEKFENLIFSSILSTPDKVPSTFDGIEQLSNLIKNIKSGN